jgi:cobyrinic acid a,c-diamide synthase
MKISVTQNKEIQLEEVYNSIVLKTKDGEEIAICMRDSGFEFRYQDNWYFAKEGKLEPFKK